MAIPVIETYYEWISTSAVSAIPLDKPSGVVTGNLLVLIVGNEDSTSTPQFVDDVSGFDLQFEIGDGVSDNHLAVYTRISQGDEAASLTVNTQSADYCYGWYVRISGPHPTLFWDFNTAGQLQSSAPINVPGADTTLSDCLAFVFAGLDGADGGAGTIAGTGWSKWRSLEATAGGSSGASGVVGTKDMAAACPAGTADVSVVVLAGPAGGLLANVNRWRGQVGLPAIDEKELDRPARKLTSAAGEAVLFDLAGPKHDQAAALRILAAVLRAGESTWFFNMTGEASPVAALKPSFVEFLNSLESPHAPQLQ